MTNHIELEPLPLEIKNNSYVRSCNVKRIDNDTQVDEVTLWFQFDDVVTPLDDNDCDTYLLAYFMDAMKEGRNIIVKGSVSKGLLVNLVEYQAAWNKWLPNTYSLVDISVHSVRDNDVVVSGAICAFSGGVDGTFSVWRHSQHKIQYGSQDIKLCAMVHGFDIPLTDEIAFDNAFNKAKETLNDIDINLVPVQTNYREIVKTNWEHSFSCALVAALSNFRHAAGTCIVGSSEPYDALIIPWGSSPITDYLLSSDGFKVIHDGASYDRTEKVKEIADWKMGVENLRVCWEGDLKDSNCGKCEKCLRTQMNFLATGNPIPNCFPNHADIDVSINNVVLRNKLARSEWRLIYEHAKENQIEGSWLTQLSYIIEKKSIIDMILPKGSRRRSIARALTQKKY